MATDSKMRWHCTNPLCRDRAADSDVSCSGGEIPVCACGSPMKKEYRPPVFRYLEFLTLDSPEPAHDTLREQ